MWFPSREVLHRQQLVRKSESTVSTETTVSRIARSHTGGFSSSCSPRSGFADRFEKTPSVGREAEAGMALKAGNSVTRRSMAGEVRGGAEVSEVVASCLAEAGSALINRCLSSPSFSASEASPSSKVSLRS